MDEQLEYELKFCEKVSPEIKLKATEFMNKLLKENNVESGDLTAFEFVKNAIDKCENGDWMGFLDDEYHKEELEKYGSVLFPVMFHFNGGMWLRNQLRDNGFGEADLPIPNLDFIYKSIIDDAIKLG